MIHFIISLVMGIPALSADVPKNSSKLSIERIFASPDLNGSLPNHLKFSPNGKRLTFLRPKQEDQEILDLWEFDLSSGQSHLLVDSKSLNFGTLSEAEKARRERMRESRRGIVEYFWSEDGNKLVFPAAGDLYLYTFGEKMKPIAQGKSPAMDIRFSPKDHFISLVREQNLFIFDLKSNHEYAVTKDGKGDLSYATAEFIAQEEMDRFTGYWWSKNEEYIALTEVDETPVKWVERYDIDADAVTVRKEHYPEAGTANAKVRLGIVRVADIVAGKATIEWMDLGKNPDIYLPRVEWTEDHKLSFQVQSRDQKTLSLYLFDPTTRKTTTVLTEKDDHWVNIQENPKWLKDSPNFIWTSEKSGFQQLYLMDRSGKELRLLSGKEGNVDDLVGVDEKAGWVYYEGWRKTPLEEHVYRVPLNALGEPELLTGDAPWSNVQMDREAQFFVRRSSNPSAPSQVSVHKADGQRIAMISDNEVKEGHPLFPYAKNLIQPEYSSFRGPSGDLIYYTLYKPKNFAPKKKYPLVVIGYGGPHVQMVRRSWQGEHGLLANVLLERGFMVATFDNRGSARRGKKFADAIDHGLGTVEVEDQKAGVEYLVKQGFIDAKRVGFFGWSYGGYLSLMLAAKASGTFHANVAVAPVSDFALYDTHYTEQFMGIPKDNREAYARANVLNFVSQIKSRLLIIHGMADDNVLFTNSTMLFKKLQESGVLYESVTYPGAKHGISGQKNSTHVFRTIVDFFERTLK